MDKLIGRGQDYLLGKSIHRVVIEGDIAKIDIGSYGRWGKKEVTIDVPIAVLVKIGQDQVDREQKRADERKRIAERAEHDRQIGFAVNDWVAENLKAGMIVKVKSSAAMKMRIVEQVRLAKPIGPWRAVAIHTFAGRHCHVDAKTGALRTGSYITDHMADKITHLWDPETKKLISIRDLITLPSDGEKD